MKHTSFLELVGTSTARSIMHQFIKARTIGGMYKLRDFIKEEELDYHKLSINTHPAAMILLSEKPNRVCWSWLSANPASIEFSMWTPENIDWREFSSNTCDVAVEYLIRNPNRIHWRNFSANPNPKAVDYVAKNLRKASWPAMFTNPSAISTFENQEIELSDIQYLAANPRMIDLVREHMNEFLETFSNDCQELFWHNISRNYAALDIIEKYPNNVDWNAVCKMPEALPLIEKMLTTVYDINSRDKKKANYVRYHILAGLSQNPAAIDILKKFAKRGIIDTCNLSANPEIFTYDYEAIKKENIALNQEFMAVFWQPSRVTMMRSRARDYESVLDL